MCMFLQYSNPLQQGYIPEGEKQCKWRNHSQQDEDLTEFVITELCSLLELNA
jgi:hypothetical protein